MAIRRKTASGESQELQWVSPDEFAALPGAEPDAVMIMTMIVERVADSWLAIPATRWSLADAPAEAMTDRSVAEATAPDPLDDRETLGWGPLSDEELWSRPGESWGWTSGCRLP